MEKGYYKEIEEITGYKEYDVEHKDEKGNLLYTEHIKEPIIKVDKVFVNYTEKEIIENRISELIDNLYSTDYKAIKFAEGLISEEEYKPIKEQRQAWRDEINELQQQLLNL